MSRLSRVLNYITSHPWAIQRETLDAILEVVELHAAGGRFSSAEIDERLAAARARQGQRTGGDVVGVIPIYGVIMPKANLMTEFSGGTTVDGLRGAFRSALADPEVMRIVFDVDSPGGSVEGIPELADEIRAARGQKPMSAVSNYLMASAAYFLAAQADEIIASPSSLTGSIGVYAIHTDRSGMNEQDGIKPTYISAGKYKVTGNPDEPLSDEARSLIQESVDYSYDQFLEAVAAGRGVSREAVQSGYGEGRALDPKPALAAGLVDRIGTLEDVLAGPPPRMRTGRRSEEEEAQRIAAFEFERERRQRTGVR